MRDEVSMNIAIITREHYIGVKNAFIFVGNKV